MADKQYNIRILGGLDHNEEPQISFSMDDETHGFLDEIAKYNKIEVNELVATFLMGASFSDTQYVN